MFTVDLLNLINSVHYLSPLQFEVQNTVHNITKGFKKNFSRAIDTKNIVDDVNIHVMNNGIEFCMKETEAFFVTL